MNNENVLVSVFKDKNMTAFYDLNAVDIDGKQVSFAEYKGKTVLIVNVASKCGFTKQYSGLEKLYQAYKAKDFVVLGFPSNQFGGQEPGTEKEIKDFCSLNFGVKFPLFKKIEVKGPNKHPVYKFLSDATKKEPGWNFTKYLVDKKGVVKGFYESSVTPESADLKKAIDAAIAEK